MVTVVNTPGTPQSNDNTMGLLIGLALVVLFLGVLFFYGIPAFTRNASQTTPQTNTPTNEEVNVDVDQPPAQEINLPDVSVPENVDVNITQPESNDDGGDTAPQPSP